jgi:hypothetical protein
MQQEPTLQTDLEQPEAFWWNVRKVRNKWIFDSIQCSELQVAFAAKEEFELYLFAWKELQPP